MSTSDPTMAQPGVHVVTEASTRRQTSEWFWRVTGLVMVIALGWIVWVAIQLAPAPLITTAAFEAAARARANLDPKTGGAIKTTAGAQSAASGSVAKGATLVAPANPTSGARTEVKTSGPPVDVERLRLSDRITTPLPAPQGDAKAGTQ